MGNWLVPSVTRLRKIRQFAEQKLEHITATKFI